MTRVYYKEAVGAFIVFDVTRAATFDAVAKWKQDLDSKVVLADERPVPAVLLANKVHSLYTPLRSTRSFIILLSSHHSPSPGLPKLQYYPNCPRLLKFRNFSAGIKESRINQFHLTLKVIEYRNFMNYSALIILKFKHVFVVFTNLYLGYYCFLFYLCVRFSVIVRL